MSLASLELTEATELEFAIEITGTDKTYSDVRFIIEGPEYGIICKCLAENGVIKTTVPKLKGILPAGSYNAKLEVMIEGKTFTPLKESIDFKPAIEMKIQSTKTVSEAAPNIQATGVKVNVLKKSPVKNESIKPKNRDLSEEKKAKAQEVLNRINNLKEQLEEIKGRK